MTIYKCDKCKEEKNELTHLGTRYSSKCIHYDLCDYCLVELDKFIKELK